MGTVTGEVQIEWVENGVQCAKSAEVSTNPHNQRDKMFLFCPFRRGKQRLSRLFEGLAQFGQFLRGIVDGAAGPVGAGVPVGASRGQFQDQLKPVKNGLNPIGFEFDDQVIRFFEV